MHLLHYNMSYTSNTFVPLECPLYFLLDIMGLLTTENSIGDPQSYRIFLDYFFLIYV